MIWTGPPALVGWVWPPVAELPPGKYTHGQAEYERDLVGRPVTKALERLATLYGSHL